MELVIPHDGLYCIGINIRYEGVDLAKKLIFQIGELQKFFIAMNLKINLRLDILF